MTKNNLSAFALSAALAMAVTAASGQTIIKGQTATNTRAATLFAQDPSSYTPEDAYAAVWEPIPEKNVMWKKRVWRTIDLKDKGNEVLTASGTPLAALLQDAAMSKVFKLYSAVNDRFTTELKPEEITALHFDPAGVTSYQLKEDWLYLEKEQKIVVRIIGIAPLVSKPADDGTQTLQPAFWIYYPSMRALMAKTNTVAKSGKITLDDFFEGRFFQSKITKISVGTVLANQQEKAAPALKDRQ